jgi:hypothetical protein
MVSWKSYVNKILEKIKKWRNFEVNRKTKTITKQGYEPQQKSVQSPRKNLEGPFKITSSNLL